MEQWFIDKQASFSELQLPSHPFKYGMTIRMRPPSILAPSHSEQTITVDHQGVQIFNLFDELDNPLVKEHLFSTSPSELTSIESLSLSSSDIGMLIVAPANSSCSLDLTRTLSSSTFTEHILIIAQPGSRIDIIDRYHGPDCQQRLANIEVIALENSTVRLAQFQFLSQGFDSSSLRAKVGEGAKVDWFVASLGAGFSRVITDSYLEGVSSSARSFGVFFGTGKEQFDLLSSSWHKGNKSYSDMFARGVLSGSSKAVYRGNIDIAADAFGCNGYQTEETLLLSESAVADAIPNLEIRNNDVACSHGATIGRLDEEKLFYLTSRGIPESVAEQMVVEGFFEPVCAKLNWPELFEIVLPLVREKLA